VVWHHRRRPGAATRMLSANSARLVDDRRVVARASGRGGRRSVRLSIADVRSDDAGTYTCEVATRPPVSADVDVTVIPAPTTRPPPTTPTLSRRPIGGGGTGRTTPTSSRRPIGGDVTRGDLLGTTTTSSRRPIGGGGTRRTTPTPSRRPIGGGGTRRTTPTPSRRPIGSDVTRGNSRNTTPTPFRPIGGGVTTSDSRDTTPTPSRRPTVFDQPPRIVKISSDSDVTAGSTVVLTCIARDIGNLNVIWLQRKGNSAPTVLTAGGARVTDNRRFSSRVTGSPARRVVTLRIDDVGPEDDADYVCQIPAVPPVSVTLHVTVIGRRPTRIIPASIPEVVVPVTRPPPTPVTEVTTEAPHGAVTTSDGSGGNKPRPMIIDVSQDAEVPVGATVEITCIVSNVEDLNVLWVRTLPGRDPQMLTANAARLSEDARFSSRVSDQGNARTVALRLKDLDADDSAIYTCELTTKPVVSVDVRIRVI
ncbi:PREDICTED: mucin-2-like, partial [Priapulus caudatus]|uniref:Mucin-2-like n=1 Tax=Priapulus caudatus TaxID=37621 RepID=A0ABM1F6W1_PRICU